MPRASPCNSCIKAGMTRCCVALGGNLGPVQETFSPCSRGFAQHSDCRIEAVSGLYRTAPVATWPGWHFSKRGSRPGNVLSRSEALLDKLLSIEADLRPNARTTLGLAHADLDLIFFGDSI